MTQTITIKDPAAPATPAQINFLKDLVEKRDCPSVAERFAFAQTTGLLKKGSASKLIDEALKAPKKTGAAASVQDWGQAKTVQAAAEQAAEKSVSLTDLPAFGYYNLDGTIYFWDVTAKDFSPTLRRLVITTSYDGKKKGSWKKVTTLYGSPKVTGTWKPFAGKHWNYKGEITKAAYVPKSFADAVLAGAKPLTEAAAGQLGKQFGICIRCGATLTDPVSVANGIGPVCAKYWA
jgi:Family of unknown function (DUF6011)